MLYYLKGDHKMKKFLTCIMVLSSMIIAGSLPIFAMDIQNSSEQNPIALENDSITYDMIDSVIKNGKIIAISDNEMDFSMTESINTVQTRGKGIIENEIKTNVKIIALEGTVDDLLSYASIIKENDGSVERSESDNLPMATITTRVYYTKYTYSDGKEYYGINKVTGRIVGAQSGSYLGSNTYITKNYAHIGQEGYTPSGYRSNSSPYEPSVSTRSWTFTAPSSWKNYPVANSSSNAVGCYYYITLTRGSESWKIELTNNIW